MPKTNLIAGLDLGTSHIKILVVDQKDGEEHLEVLYQDKEPAFGVRRGVVVDSDKVSRIIQILLNRARTELGQKINSVNVGIGGGHIFCTSSRGMVAVSRADRKVSEEDVKRVLQSAQTVSLPSNNEILETFPRNFFLDNEVGTKEVVGMQGSRLETEVLVLAGFSPYKNNLTEAVLDAGLQISDIIPSPLASALAVLSPRQKELGVALLDIGAGTSELAVFEEGELAHLAVFPAGSANITNDIAIGLKTDVDVAEAIKIERGRCLFKGKDKKERIEAEGEETLVFSQKMLARIIEARVSQIFSEVQKELKKISKQGDLPAGIVLTGGGSKIPHIVELAKKELKLPCRLGKPTHFSGLDDASSFATACGLVMADFDFGKIESRQSITHFSVSGGGIVDKIKKIFKIFLP
jgi:cell division protein FtsA